MRRCVIAIATIATAMTAGCSSSSGTAVVACTVTLGEEASTVEFPEQPGSASTATIAGYDVTFKVTDDGGLTADVRGANGAFVAGTASDGVNATGSATTPDGQIEFVCRG